MQKSKEEGNDTKPEDSLQLGLGILYVHVLQHLPSGIAIWQGNLDLSCSNEGGGALHNPRVFCSFQ